MEAIHPLRRRRALHFRFHADEWREESQKSLAVFAAAADEVLTSSRLRTLLNYILTVRRRPWAELIAVQQPMLECWDTLAHSPARADMPPCCPPPLDCNRARTT